METIINKIDEKIAEYKALVMDKIKTGRENGEDSAEFTRYLGIVEGMLIVKDIIDKHGDDGK